MPAGNLPAEPNTFVGRERDLAELARLLGEVRVLTLCGPGGIGKTRLATRLASQLAGRFPDGAWLVELADTTDPGQLPQRAAAALGIRTEQARDISDTLAAALAPRRALLILDTCEHLVGPCAEFVFWLLTACPQLRVIATSQEPLRLHGETAWRVPPLQLPAAAARLGEWDRLGGRAGGGDRAGGQSWADELPEAVLLFAERAAAARPDFRLDEATAPAVAAICRALDGMPLAIELAAARVRALAVPQIAERIDDRLSFLATGTRTAPPRQQTLRAAVDWSYELLSQPEQALLRRLSVFAGWNLELAEQVCADEIIPAGQVLELLGALADKSLVATEAGSDGARRYRLPDTIRRYARERLDQAGEGPRLRRRHRDYLLEQAETAVAQAFVSGDPPWSQRVSVYHKVARERANYELALADCARAGDAEAGLRICYALRAIWVTSGDVATGAAWLDRMQELGGIQPPADLRTRALMMRAELAFEQQDYQTAAACAAAGLALSREAGCGREAGGLRILALVALRAGRIAEARAQVAAACAAAQAAGDQWEEGLALASRGAIEARDGQLDQAQQSLEQALAVLAGNNGWGLALVRYGLGQLAGARQQHPAALTHLRAAVGLWEQVAARPEIARALAGIGWVALAQGDLELAGRSLSDSARLSLAIGHRLAIARGLEALAMLAAARDDPARAAQLAGAAQALREAAGEALSPRAAQRREQLIAAVTGILGPDQAAELLAQGRELSADAAVRLGVGEPDRRAPVFAASRGRAGWGSPVGPVSPADAAAAANGAGGPLTARELEIAVLVARGLSNRQIAAELFISPATAARHIANIFTKLDFNSRTQLALWATEHGLTEQPGPDPVG